MASCLPNPTNSSRIDLALAELARGFKATHALPFVACLPASPQLSQQGCHPKATALQTPTDLSYETCDPPDPQTVTLAQLAGSSPGQTDSRTFPSLQDLGTLTFNCCLAPSLYLSKAYPTDFLVLCFVLAPDMVMNLLIQRCTIHSCTHAPMHPSFTHSQLCNRHDLQENRDLAGLFSPEGYIQLKWLPAKSSPATEALERMGVSACLEDTDGPCFCLGSWVLKLPFQ